MAKFEDEMNDKEIFYCFSLKLFFKLKENGFRYLWKAEHPKTKRVYWAFKKSEYLSAILSEFGEEKKKFLNSK